MEFLESVDGQLEYASSCCIPTTWIDFTLLEVQPYNHDTSIFTFGIPYKYLNLPTCACLLLLAPDVEHGGGDAIRPYTPISPRNKEFKFDLLVKRYDEWGTKCEDGSLFSYFNYNTNPHSYKPKGVVSNYIFERQIGDVVKVFNYKLLITIIISSSSMLQKILKFSIHSLE